MLSLLLLPEGGEARKRALGPLPPMAPLVRAVPRWTCAEPRPQFREDRLRPGVVPKDPRELVRDLAGVVPVEPREFARDLAGVVPFELREDVRDLAGVVPFELAISLSEPELEKTGDRLGCTSLPCSSKLGMAPVRRR